MFLAARNTACYNGADGCPRWFRWATPSIGYRKAVSLVLTAFQLLAQPSRFGHAPGSRFHQPDDRSHQVQDLNSQVHGQITSFLRKRRCQHAGLTPPTVCEFYHDLRYIWNKCSCLRSFSSKRVDWVGLGTRTAGTDNFKSMQRCPARGTRTITCSCHYSQRNVAWYSSRVS